MIVCCVVGCSSRIDQCSSQNISFHRFPSDEKRKKLWLMAMRRAYWTPQYSSIVCSLHFEDDCFDKTGSSMELLPHAIPTIFPSHRSHFQDEYMKERHKHKETDLTFNSSSTQLNKSEIEKKVKEDEANLETVAIFSLKNEIKQLERKLDNLTSSYENKLKKIKLLEQDLNYFENEM